MNKTLLIQDGRKDIEKIFLKNTIKSILKSFSARDNKIIYYRYYEGLTFREIASLLNISRCRVGQLSKNILKKLRHPLRMYKLYEFFYDKTYPDKIKICKICNHRYIEINYYKEKVCSETCGILLQNRINYERVCSEKRDILLQNRMNYEWKR